MGKGKSAAAVPARLNVISTGPEGHPLSAVELQRQSPISGNPISPEPYPLETMNTQEVPDFPGRISAETMAALFKRIPESVKGEAFMRLNREQMDNLLRNLDTVEQDAA